MWRMLCVLAALPLLADEQTRRLADRLSEEAAAFQRLAPQVIGEELLIQRALKPPPRFRPRIGDAARKPLEPEWRERRLRSEYSFAVFAGESNAIHELRQVTEVDGKKIADSRKAQDALAEAITASNDDRKKQLLKDFERHGLYGAVTDFGQLILLFTPRSIERYEFAFLRRELRGGAPLLVFSYKQVDGPEALTLIEGRKNDQPVNLRIQGEVWVWASNYRPVRISMLVIRGEGGDSVREEATVDYEQSPYGAVLPLSTDHREIRAGALVAENQFTYADFKKFAASSDINFAVDPAPSQ